MLLFLLLDSLFYLIGLAGLLSLALTVGWGFLVCMDHYFLGREEDDGVYYPQTED